ncbi:hypothetical protein [Streptomyces sp. NRRL B-3648]|uniref:hypothetical protein n=1 Tax=Streptomyces sp. NRRL B-3648 TaxID=1519493 RepID=UPI001F334678|nr:hypothetical protein [Streptomyces sp. NRRL B-3648]
MNPCAAGAAGNDFSLALELAVRDERAGRHTIETLDPAHANAGSAAALVALLRRVWCDEIATPPATAELRRLMGLQGGAGRPVRSCICGTRSGSSRRSPGSGWRWRR